MVQLSVSLHETSPGVLLVAYFSILISIKHPGFLLIKEEETKLIMKNPKNSSASQSHYGVTTAMHFISVMDLLGVNLLSS